MMWESAEMSLCSVIAPSLRSGSKSVVSGAVVPQDLSLALLGDRQRQERLDRPRELRVAVREVGREEGPVVTDRVYVVSLRLLVVLRRHEALPLDLGAGGHRQLLRVEVA